jgi:UDP-2,3-diacylglucosamine hydrolase
MGDPNRSFKLIRAIFHNRFCQWMFSSLHPRWGLAFGLSWARHSYIRHKERDDVHYMGEDKEHLVLFAKEYIESHPDIDYFIFGHRHIELDIKLERHTRLMIIGDWISQFTYAVFDGEHMFLEEYVEGESQP